MFDGNLPNLDIRSFMRVLVIVLALGSAFLFLRGLGGIRESRRLKYYRLRRSTLMAGWRLVLIALGLGAVAFLAGRFGEPAVYSFYPITATPSPSPAPSQTPTITETPTITLTPSITPTLSESYTPTPTQTPSVPLAVEAQFSASATPPAEAVFSPLRFAQDIDLAFNPINPAESFTNPIRRIFAIFSYDKMADGVQWTALWYRNGELVYFETDPWEGGTGGFGYSDYEPEPEAWLPGNYQVQIFVGLELKITGDFELVGFPATRTPTATNTATATITPTPSPSHTRWPTQTYTATWTPLPPTATQIPTSTPWPTSTPVPTRTFRPTITPSPTWTKLPTKTPPN